MGYSGDDGICQTPHAAKPSREECWMNKNSINMTRPNRAERDLTGESDHLGGSRFSNSWSVLTLACSGSQNHVRRPRPWRLGQPRTGQGSGPEADRGCRRNQSQDGDVTRKRDLFRRLSGEQRGDPRIPRCWGGRESKLANARRRREATLG